MRYLRLVILISIFGFGLNTAALAVCCPGGCVDNGYGGCWRTGTNNYCAPTSCSGSSGSSGGGSGGGTPGVAPPSYYSILPNILSDLSSARFRYHSMCSHIEWKCDVLGLFV